jgi:hypothetical protein
MRAMSLLPAFLDALKRKDDAAPGPPSENDSRDDKELSADVFNLIPPQPANDTGPEKPAEDAPDSRDVRPLGAMDLSRLSIDNDGRLYWDGKPVEVRRRITMSRAQIVGASVIGAFVVIGAIGAAIQGSAAARDWACRFGWTADYCSLPSEKPPPPIQRPDIPA